MFFFCGKISLLRGGPKEILCGGVQIKFVIFIFGGPKLGGGGFQFKKNLVKQNWRGPNFSISI